MSHATSTPGVTSLPDAPRASEATTTASTKEAAAQRLVRGENVRTTSAKALVHAVTGPGALASGHVGYGTTDTSDTTDDDAGTTLATDTVASARGAAALHRRLRRRRTTDTDTTGTGDGTATDDALAGDDSETADTDTGTNTGTNTGGDADAPTGDVATGRSNASSAPTEGDVRGDTARPTSRTPNTSDMSTAAPASAPEAVTAADASTPSATPTSRRRGAGLDVTPRPTVATDTPSTATESTAGADSPVRVARGAHDRQKHQNHQDHQNRVPTPPPHHRPGPTTNGTRNVTPRATAGRESSMTLTSRANHTLRANRRRTIERRRATTVARRSLVTGTPVAKASTAAATTTAAPATMAVAAPIVVCALVLWAIFMMLMTLLVGGAADEDRLMGARLVAEIATEAFETGANRGDYHWKGQAFRDYVGGTTGAWDAAFCSWCLGQAGFVEGGLVGRYASVDSFVARFTYDEGAGEVHAPDDLSYTPEVGDLLVLWAGTDAARIEVVTAVSADGQSVTTVAGDAAGGEAGSYDRDADGYGGYVAATERAAHAADTTYLHPHYATDGATDAP